MNSMKHSCRIFLAFIFGLCSLVTNAEQTLDVSAAQLLSMQSAAKSEPFIVLDVRSAEEFAQGHIAGAMNISHTELANNLDKLAQYKHHKVIVHCRSGKRAGIALTVLEQHDFTQLRHLAGDMNGWRDNNLPVITQP